MTGTITVVEAKTKSSRTFPLNSTLEEFLRLIPPSKRTGFIVPSNYSNRVDGLIELERSIKRLMTAIFKQRHPPIRMPRKTSEQYKALLKEYFQGDKVKMKAAFDEECREWEMPLGKILERVGWNSFRHTFGSLLAQGGVSIDKISAWMGNTPEVCRRHYAQFVPRDRRDEEIDKL